MEKLGVHPHRCYMCRLRFYLLKPVRLKAFVAALDRPLVTAEAPRPRPVGSAVEASGRSMIGRTGTGNAIAQ
ncbi:MAG TPA: hypothetical protein VKX49_02270 [Bryobacteraceae bacterium]|nr:hypothetical protein [Bryobacteraceae bacterium]